MSIRSYQRRTFLKSAGVCLALPVLESSEAARAASASRSVPQRLVCIGNEFGMYPDAFWPKADGRDYELSPLLKPLQEHRNDFTLFSHLDHGLKGGHFAIHGFLTGVKAADARNLPEGGISLDQKAAEHVGAQTRFPSLAIGSDNGVHGGCQMSWTRTGTRVPPIPGPRELFRQLFLEDGAEARRSATARIQLQESILDAVLGDANSLKRKLNKSDGQKLEEYFSSVRDVERKLELDRQWQQVPKPETDLSEPVNQGLVKDMPAVYDLIALALQTDSTRVATLEIGHSFAVQDLGIKKGYHSLSHHGKVQANIDLLVQIEMYQLQQLARFLDKLKSIREPDSDGTLLDHTMVLHGSGMGNANSHTNSDLPLILAGGGFQHGEQKRYPAEGRSRVPLCNLFVSLLQRFGVETDQFGTSTSTLTGLS
ncbi:MAG: DUF1552 domain-containing protein [Planctomycetaceae bacterium]